MAAEDPTRPDPDRLSREQDFWDIAHTMDLRRPARRFYAIASSRESLYRRWVLDAGAGINRRALELGAFKDGAAFTLAWSGADATGIDISPMTVEGANITAEGFGLGETLRFEVMDAERLDFPDDTFDVVCGSAIIHHLDLARAIPEIVRVLRPGGTAVFTEPMAGNPFLERYRRRTPEMRTPDEHPLNSKDLEMLGVHLENVEVVYWHLTSIAAVPLARMPFFRKALRALEAVDRWLFHFPAARGWAWYVVVRARKPGR